MSLQEPGLLCTTAQVRHAVQVSSSDAVPLCRCQGHHSGLRAPSDGICSCTLDHKGHDCRIRTPPAGHTRTRPPAY